MILTTQTGSTAIAQIGDELVFAAGMARAGVYSYIRVEKRTITGLIHGEDIDDDAREPHKIKISILDGVLDYEVLESDVLDVISTREAAA